MTIINAVTGTGPDPQLVSIDNAVTEFPQTFSPPTGYDGLSSVTVQAPANFKASNIKKDVEIAGVTGTYDPQPRLQQKSEKATAFPVVVEPDADYYDGLSKATVTAPDNLTAKNIKYDVTIAGVTGTYGKTTTRRLNIKDMDFNPNSAGYGTIDIVPGTGISGLSSVTIYNGPTTTEDTPLRANNIKKGVNILGYVGTYEPPLSEIDVTPTEFPTVVTNESDYYYGMKQVTVTAPVNLTSDNIKKGVEIAGITGTYVANLVGIYAPANEFPVVLKPGTGQDGFSYVSVSKPANLEAGNIKKGVEIAGITGTYEGDVTDELFKQLTADTLETVPASVTEGLSETPEFWIYDKNNVKEVVLSDSIKTIGQTSINKCTNLTTINTGGVESFNYQAMSKLSSLKSVDLSSATSLSSYCFESCGLESVYIPKLAEMSGGCFRYCKSLKNAKICCAGGLNDGLFDSCTSLTDVVILDGSTDIPARAFFWCSNLKSLILEPTTPPTLGSKAFLGASSSFVITVPKGTLETYKSATNWSEYADKMVEAEE